MILFVRNTQSNEVLIGYSDSPKKRLADLQRKSLVRLESLGTTYGDHEDKLKYHRQFDHSHVKGDWFKPGILAHVQMIIRAKPTSGPTPTNVILGGDGTFSDRELVFRSLNELHRKHPIGCVNFGGTRDFEEWARAWAKQNGIPERPYYPDYGRQGWVAPFKVGPRMLRSKIDAKLLLVFLSDPVTSSTKSLIRLARKLEIEVVEKTEPARQPQPTGTT